MLSKKTIIDALDKVAKSNGLTGESVELLKDELAYTLFHEQLEITNAIQESNLSTAFLINSKIRSCMDTMYSVYRGKNVRVELKIKPDIAIEFNKFDEIFVSNTFKVYAEESRRLDSGIAYDGDYRIESSNKELVGILADRDLYEVEIPITEKKYFVDAKIDTELLVNLSEDIQVFIDEGMNKVDNKNKDWIEYNVTRNFFDFINEPFYGEDDVDANGERLRNSLFALTLPDYGLRLYKRGYFVPESNTDNSNGYFTPSRNVKIRALKYTTAAEILPDEFNKIIVPGSSFILVNEANPESYYKLDYETGQGLIKEIKREDGNSLLYTANFYSRLQSKILSRSDINHLFNEIFIDKVLSAKNWYDGMNVYVSTEDGQQRPVNITGPTEIDFKGTINGEYYDGKMTLPSQQFKDGNIWIFYVPRDRNILVDTKEFSELYVNRYRSYLISPFVYCAAGVPIDITVDLSIYMNTDVDITSKIKQIYDKYSNILNIPTQFDIYFDLSRGEEDQVLDIVEDNIFKPSKIKSELSKIGEIDFIESIDYNWTYYEENGTAVSKHFIECNENSDDIEKSIPEAIWNSFTEEEKENIKAQSIQNERDSYPPLLVYSEANEINIPTYLNFILRIRYKSSYDLINNHG